MFIKSNDEVIPRIDVAWMPVEDIILCEDDMKELAAMRKRIVRAITLKVSRTSMICKVVVFRRDASRPKLKKIGPGTEEIS